MSKNTWSQIKLKKNFYVNVYRLGISFLICSLLLSVILILLICKIYLNEPERDYYATNGITPPVQLTALAQPNMSSSPLLAADPQVDYEDRSIPQ